MCTDWQFLPTAPSCLPRGTRRYQSDSLLGSLPERSEHSRTARFVGKPGHLRADWDHLCHASSEERALRLWTSPAARNCTESIAARAHFRAWPIRQTASCCGRSCRRHAFRLECSHRQRHQSGKVGDILDEIAFTPDSRVIVWGCQKEKTIHLWEIRSGQERYRLRGHHGSSRGWRFRRTAPSGVR